MSILPAGFWIYEHKQNPLVQNLWMLVGIRIEKALLIDILESKALAELVVREAQLTASTLWYFRGMVLLNLSRLLIKAQIELIPRIDFDNQDIVWIFTQFYGWAVCLLLASERL